MPGDWRERVKWLLNERGISMRAASRAIGRNETYLRDILERGQEPSAANLLALAGFLMLSLPEMMGEAPGTEDVAPPRQDAHMQGIFARIAAAPEDEREHILGYAEWYLGEVAKRRQMKTT